MPDNRQRKGELRDGSRIEDNQRRDASYAPCDCGTWPTPSDQRAGICRVCHHYRAAVWYFEAGTNTFRKARP